MILEPASPAEEILRSCALLMAPGDVHEVRILNAGRDATISGYFDDPKKLAAAVLLFDGKVPGIYITLNPVKPALLARAKNRLQNRARVTTSDNDILRRRRLLIDCDPVRPSGISSTGYEHGRALAVASSVWDCMRAELGDPEAIADSSNGAHLTYLTDLPNDQRSTELIKSILANTAERCATQDISIDTTVCNAARIVKLWGTLTCKGDSTAERPHRRSRLLEIEAEL